jgi:hypothetical protein
VNVLSEQVTAQCADQHKTVVPWFPMAEYRHLGPTAWTHPIQTKTRTNPFDLINPIQTKTRTNLSDLINPNQSIRTNKKEASLWPP